jgi:hypothetical protein
VKAFAAIRIVAYAALAVSAQAQQTTNPQETVINHTVKGSFDVKMTPAEGASAESPFNRMIINKQYHGNLEAGGKGQMLASGTGAKGSTGVYIALEQVTGTLDGRKGSFILQHSGVMVKGVPDLSVKVVPGSGTDELTGISGTMNIIIAPDGKHSYEFAYTLAPVQ